MDSRVRMIPFKQIDRTVFANHRTDYGDMDELVQSLKTNGQLQSVIVRHKHFGGRGFELPGGEKVYDLFPLVAGGRRIEAMDRIRKEAQAANERLGKRRSGGALPFDEVMAVVRQGNDVDAIVDQLVENLHRKDPNPLETAEGIRALDNLHYPMDKIALRIGRSAEWCEKLLKLRDSCKHEVHAALSKGEITLSAAFVIMKKPMEEQGDLLKTYRQTKADGGSRNKAKRALDKAAGNLRVLPWVKVTKTFQPIRDLETYTGDFWDGARAVLDFQIGSSDDVVKRIKAVEEERKAPA